MRQSSSHPRHFIIVGVLIAISTLVVNWLLGLALPIPPQASAEAVIIDSLISKHLFMIAFLFSLVTVFMIYSLIVFRRREDDDEDGEHFEGNTLLEIVWTVVPAITVLIFIGIGIRSMNAINVPKENELVVNVTGRQWSWSFEYEGGVLSDELVLPVNQPVFIKLKAEDVIHSFWVPAFRLKQDLVPGTDTKVHFTPTTVGEYRLRCAELCGNAHFSMRADVRVVEKDEFAMWLDQGLAKANPEQANATD